MRADELAAALGVGINLGCRFEDPINPTSFDSVKRALDAIFAKGFRHVRIPVTWISGQSNKLDNAKFVGELRAAMDYAISLGLKVIVNAHHEKWLLEQYDGSDAMTDKFKQLWARIATLFRGLRDKDVVYEVLNEPRAKFGDGDAAATDACIALTRKINKAGYDAISHQDQDGAGAAQRSGGRPDRVAGVPQRTEPPGGRR